MQVKGIFLWLEESALVVFQSTQDKPQNGGQHRAIKAQVLHEYGVAPVIPEKEVQRSRLLPRTSEGHTLFVVKMLLMLQHSWPNVLFPQRAGNLQSFSVVSGWPWLLEVRS